MEIHRNQGGHAQHCSSSWQAYTALSRPIVGSDELCDRAVRLADS